MEDRISCKLIKNITTIHMLDYLEDLTLSSKFKSKAILVNSTVFSLRNVEGNTRKYPWEYLTLKVRLKETKFYIISKSAKTF